MFARQSSPRLHQQSDDARPNGNLLRLLFGWRKLVTMEDSRIQLSPPLPLPPSPSPLIYLLIAWQPAQGDHSWTMQNGDGGSNEMLAVSSPTGPKVSVRCLPRDPSPPPPHRSPPQVNHPWLMIFPSESMKLPRIDGVLAKPPPTGKSTLME